MPCIALARLRADARIRRAYLNRSIVHHQVT